MHIETRRREVDLNRNARSPQVAHARYRPIKVAAHAHAAERSRRCAVETHLHGLHAETVQALAILRRQVVPVGLDLQLPAAGANALDHFEESRVEHRFTAGEGQVRDFVIHHLVDHVEDLPLIELVTKRLARPAFLDAMQAREIALVGNLPGDVKRRR